MVDSDDEEDKLPNEESLPKSRPIDDDARPSRRPPISSTNVTAVVKLFVKKVNACYTAPWRKESQSGSTGTGFLINFQDQLLIVTNAHVVHRATTILARSQSGPPVKFRCEIHALSLNFDLATLRLVEQDGRAWDTIRLATGSGGFGFLPHLDDNVTCVGFPCGGDQISVTRGVVSRIDVNSHGVLRIQIDAAINPGNSGGPVFDQTGAVVGIASSHLVKGSNIGYIIPASVVHLFLNTPRESEPGISSLGITGFQALESTTLRRCLGLLPSFLGGVRVSGIAPLGATASCLELDDVLIAVDGVLIGQDGTVQLPGRASERISFDALITLKPPGSKVRLTVARRADSSNKDPLALDIPACSASSSMNASPLPLPRTMWGGASPRACMASNSKCAQDVSPLATDAVLFRFDSAGGSTQEKMKPATDSSAAAESPGPEIAASTFTGSDALESKQPTPRAAPRRGSPWPVSRPLLLAPATPESVDPELAIAFDVVVTLTPCQFLCPRIDGYDAFPDYLIVGGCVFLPLTTPWCVAKKQLTMLQQYSGALEKEGSQVIVMSKVLAHAVNVGYHNWSCLVLLTANGVAPRNLRHLAEIVSAPNQDILKFRLRNDSGEDMSASTYLVCLDAEECKKAEEDILSAHLISSPCSFNY